MNFKTTAVLAIFVAIGLIVWMTSGEKPEDTGPAQPETVPMVTDPPERERVARIRIERGAKPGIVFERDADGTKAGTGAWQLREPVAAPAQSAMLDRLVDELLSAKADVAWKPGARGAVSREQAGLDQPRGVVTLTTIDDQSLAFQIGADVPLSSDLYLGVMGDDRVFLSRRAFMFSRLLDTEVEAYREKQLVAPGGGAAQSLKIDWAGKSWEFAARDGAWRLTSPVQAPAIAAAVEELARKIAVVRIVDFIDDNPASLRAYGLERPHLTFEVTFEKQRLANPEILDGKDEEPRLERYEETYRLKVGGFADLEKKDTRYIQWGDNPWVATASSAALDALQPNLDKLRDPSIFALPASAMERVRVTRDGESYALRRGEGGWIGEEGLADAGVVEIDPDAATEFVQALAELRASDFEDEPADFGLYGLDAPKTEFEVTTRDGETARLRIGGTSPSGANTFARVDESGSVAILTTARVEQIALPPIAFAARRMTDFDAADIGRITIEQGDRAYDAMRHDNGWKLLKPGGAPANGVALERLALDISQLRAKRVIGRGELGAFGAAGAQAAIAFDTPGENGEWQTNVLRVAETADGHAHAALDGRALVYEIDRTVFDVLSAELINPQLFTFSPAQIRSIEIRKGAEVLSFQRGAADEAWLFGIDKSVSLKQRVVNDLTRMIADLRVERFLKYLDADLAVSSLSAAPRTVVLTLDDGRTVTLQFEAPEFGPSKRGAWVESGRTFELSDGDAALLFRGPDSYIDASGG